MPGYRRSGSPMLQALALLEQEGVIPPLLTLVQTPDVVIEASAAELLAKLAQVRLDAARGVP